jgi:ketosteroid isomerase-like protein
MDEPAGWSPPATSAPALGGRAMATTDVSKRNIEMARKGYAAFNDGDIETAMSTFSDDIVWHAGKRGPLAGDYKGKAALLGMFAKFGQLTEGSYKAEIHDILVNDEHGVVIGAYKATRNGKALEEKFVDVVHMNAEGQATEFWRFQEDQIGALEWLEG